MTSVRNKSHHETQISTELAWIRLKLKLFMRHPNIKLTADGGAAPYIHSPRCLYAEEDLDFIFTSLDDIEIIDEMEES